LGIRSVAVETHARRFTFERDPRVPVTPLSSIDLRQSISANAGLFSDWVKSCPLRPDSFNAPNLTDFPGTITRSVLGWKVCRAHITGLRADTANATGLGKCKLS
jgi:hypothetical protein